MAEPAFNPEGCEIESIDRIPPCEQMLVDATVPDPPPAIGGCPPADLRNVPDPTCPEILPPVDTPSSVEYVNTPSSYKFGFTHLDGCVFELTADLEIHRPLLTPTTATTINLYTANGVTGYVRHYFTMTGECDYLQTIEAMVPCTWLAPQTATYSNFTWGSGPTTQTGGIGWYFAKDPAACDYTLNMALTVPCPQIRHTTVVHINYHEVADSYSAGASGSGYVNNYPEPYVANGRLEVSQPVCNDWYWTLTLNLQEPGVLWQNSVLQDVGYRSIAEAMNATGVYINEGRYPARAQINLYAATPTQQGAVSTNDQFWRGEKVLRREPTAGDEAEGYTYSDIFQERRYRPERGFVATNVAADFVWDYYDNKRYWKAGSAPSSIFGTGYYFAPAANTGFPGGYAYGFVAPRGFGGFSVTGGATFNGVMADHTIPALTVRSQYKAGGASGMPDSFALSSDSAESGPDTAAFSALWFAHTETHSNADGTVEIYGKSYLDPSAGGGLGYIDGVGVRLSGNAFDNGFLAKQVGMFVGVGVYDDTSNHPYSTTSSPYTSYGIGATTIGGVGYFPAIMFEPDGCHITHYTGNLWLGPYVPEHRYADIGMIGDPDYLPAEKPEDSEQYEERAGLRIVRYAINGVSSFNRRVYYRGIDRNLVDGEWPVVRGGATIGWTTGPTVASALAAIAALEARVAALEGGEPGP